MSQETRGYLGMSSLGHPCMRKLWYQFRLCGSNLPPFAPWLLRLFARGHLEEVRINEYLRNAGIQLYEVNPQTGKQFEYVAAYGHAKGHSDGLVFNLPERPLEWGLLEEKTHNSNNFGKLKRQGVKKAHPIHYCQCQRYMEAHNRTYQYQHHQPRLNFALYIGVCKNTDHWYAEIIEYDTDAIDMLLNREMSVIESDSPPQRLINDKDFYTCKFCDFRAVCHERHPYPKHCRTCEWIAVCDNGEWRCENFDQATPSGPLTLAEQLIGCQGYSKHSLL